MKKKLRFQVEKRRVEQFEDQPNFPVARGTVQAFRTEGPDAHPWYRPSEPHRICVEMPGTRYLAATDCC